ncbi:MAG TPA: sulfurtransferase TusA family protein [Egibacteraceae bacterium]
MSAEPVVVDALGRACPLPVIDLAQAVEQAAVGDEIVVLADDPGAKVDIPVWCRMRRQEFLGMSEAERGWSFRVRKTS